MKKLLQIILITGIFLSANKASMAQNYPAAVGLKFGGYENGISFKYFAHNDVAYEGELGFRSHGLVITGLIEKHLTAFGLSELKFYYGAGAHLGSIGTGGYQKIGGGSEVYSSNQLLLGADAVIGLEYIIPNAPIAISLDLDPRFEIAGGPFFDIAPGLGIKYTF